MNEEEAIERLKYIDMQYDCNNYYSRYDLDCIETVLNLLEKKDKMIDEMAETLRYYNGMQQEQCFCIDICGEKECDMKNCKERIKQYVEYKVEEDK